MKIMHKLLWFLRPLGGFAQALLGVGIACTVSLLIVSHSSSPKAPTPTSVQPAPAQPEPSQKEDANPAKITLGQPARLRIPKIGVDTAIEQLGVVPGGNMQSPAKTKNAGWYKFGPQPGNNGSAVIAGHFGSGSYRGKSVFDDLHMLSKGDEIFTEDEAGRVAAFTVQGSQIYAKDEIVPRVFISSDRKAHLNLVTCQGKWKGAEQTYENRLVVFANKIDE